MKLFEHQTLASWSMSVALLLLVSVVCPSEAISETASSPTSSVVGLSLAATAGIEGDAANVSVSLDEDSDDNDETVKEHSSNEMVGIITATQSASGRGVISDIAKLKKIGEILETVGETVIPALVESQTQKSLLSAVTGDSQAKQPFGLKLIHALKQQEGFGEEANASTMPV